MNLPSHLFVSCDGAMYDTRRPDWSARPLRPDYGVVRRTIERDTQPIRAAIRAGYAWPGGYELVFMMSDGECLCMDCARENYRQISASTRTGARDGWRVVSTITAEEIEDFTPCANCGRDLSGHAHY